MQFVNLEVPVEGGRFDGLQAVCNGIKIGDYIVYGSMIFEDEVYSPDNDRQPTKLIYKGKCK